MKWLDLPLLGRSRVDPVSVPHGGPYPGDLLHHMTTLSCASQMQTETMRECTDSTSWKEDPVSKIIWQDIISFSSCDMIRCPLPVRLWKLVYLSLERCTANSMSVEELSPHEVSGTEKATRASCPACGLCLAATSAVCKKEGSKE